MAIATKILEDKKFLFGFLNRSCEVLLQSHLLAEKLLGEANISWFKGGYVQTYVQL